jgi:hypothetical protein
MKRECFSSHRVSANCDRCGCRPEVLHMPMRLHGWFCPSCCPVCCADPPVSVVPQKIQGKRGVRA